MKKVSIKSLIILIILPLFLVACGSKEPEWKPKRAPRPSAASPDKAQETNADTGAGKKITDSKISRNPFLSYLLLTKERRKVAKIRGPLECCDLNLFNVVAVVVSEDNAFVLIQAPDNKRYIVRRGDLIGNRGGRIIKIDPEGITVREYVRDDKGKVLSSKDAKLKLPSKEEG
ncbi:MAG: hypothetical protein BMS9Abin23_0067 [Thermodesulfobacteriota bacterium]|nr:MAG: hypothetical protein BMS9Abin23_0067 [Thermodesulfobacteriota bacterium]